MSSYNNLFLLPFHLARLRIISVRTMFTTAHTTDPALEMVFFGEDDVPLPAHVKIFGIELGFVRRIIHRNEFR